TVVRAVHVAPEAARRRAATVVSIGQPVAGPRVLHGRWLGWCRTGGRSGAACLGTSCSGTAECGGDAAGVLVVGRVEELGGALLADDGRGGEDRRHDAALDEQRGRLHLDLVDDGDGGDGRARP